MRAVTLISSVLAIAQLAGFNPGPAAVDTYKGEDMTIAILDSGFTLTHELFTITDETPRITKESSDALLSDTSIADNENAPESVYVSPKIPFAYDYGDNDTDLSQNTYDYHGTAMISIAAGNKALAEAINPDFVEIAPEAQILAMKVYSDLFGEVTANAMCAAIEDSLILGADVILIGITDMQNLEQSTETEKVNAAIAKAEAEGVIVVSAAGNAVNPGINSIFDREQSIGMVTTENPDVGTLSWSGSINSTLCVTNADSNVIKSDCFILSDGTHIPYSDSNQLFKDATNGKSFSDYFDGRTPEYIVTDGIGTPEELAVAGDLSGKLAVITRGDITFVEKAINAANLGAIGVIVVDTEINATSTLTMSMELTGAPIPAIIVSKDSGALLAACEDKTITVKTGEAFTTKLRETPTIADGTAYGTTANLEIKPDLAAIGTSVCCAAYDGAYGYLTSTTAAAARVAGMCTLVKARFADLFTDIDNAELMNITKAVLVSSAQIVAPSYSVAYSPRIQGGGTADLDFAMRAGILLTSNGKYKIELGDNMERTLDFEITAYNFSGIKRMFKLDAIVGSDGFMDLPAIALDSDNDEQPLSERLGYSPSDTVSFILPFTPFVKADVTLDGESSQLNSFANDYTAHRFALESGSSKTFNVKITIDEETYNVYREKFENGFFIEGFMRLSAGNDIASIPFLAFSGDFGAAPTLDADIYSGKQAIYDSTYLYLDSVNSQSDHYQYKLGKITSGSSVEYSADRLVFSPINAGANSSVMLNLSLLRSVYDVTVTVSDSEGEVISTSEYKNLKRTYTDYSSGRLTSPTLYIWNGRADDNSAYIYPDGDYTVTVSYRPTASEEAASFSYKLSLDSTAPTIETSEFIFDGDKTLFKLTAGDNYNVDTILICDNAEVMATSIGNDTWDVSELTGKYIYADVRDTAQNSTVIRLVNPNYTEPAD